MPYAITGHFLKSGNVLLVRRKVLCRHPQSPFAHLLFALTHLTSARTTGIRCAMKCLVRPPSPGRIKYQITKKERNHNKVVIASFLKSGNVLSSRALCKAAKFITTFFSLFRCGLFPEVKLCFQNTSTHSTWKLINYKYKKISCNCLMQLQDIF